MVATLGVGALLIVAALVLILTDSGSSASQIVEVSGGGPGASNIPYPTIDRITAEEAFAMAESDEALIVDVRDAASFVAGHAAGSLSLPEEVVAARSNELPRDQLIITYCT